MKTFFQIILFLGVLVSVKVLFFYEHPLVGIDDANIYFRYVKNVHDGHGLVWNAGAERVEGFTSALWMGVLSVIYFVGPGQFEHCVFGVGFLLTAMLLSLVFSQIKKYTHSNTYGWYSVLLLSAIPGFIDWNVGSLMETGIWIYINTMLLLCLLNKQYGVKFGVLLFLMPWTRPEGMMLAGLLVGLKGLNEWLAEDKKLMPVLVQNLKYVLLIALSMGSIFYLRMQYFGYPFPNTYYAKVSGSAVANMMQGVKYIGLFVLCCPALVLMIAWLLARISKQAIRTKSLMGDNQLVLIFVMVSMCLPLLTGGDHFPYFRYYQHVVPAIVILFLVQIHLLKIAIKNWQVISFLFLVQLSAYPLKLDLVSPSGLNIESGIAITDRRTASTLNILFADKKPSVGIVTVGGFGYIYEGTVNDLLGLNNVQMAHECKNRTGVSGHSSFDANIFFEQRPDIVLPVTLLEERRAIKNMNKNWGGKSYTSKYLKDVFHDDRFLSYYTVGKIEKGNDKVFGNFSKAFIHDLPADFTFTEYVLNKDHTAIETK